MARETKIGLIVGLTFIICFAVILANRGRPRPANAPVTYAVDRGVSGPQIAKRVDAAPRRAFKPAGPAMTSPTTSDRSHASTSAMPVEALTYGVADSSTHRSRHGSPGIRVETGGDAVVASPYPSNRSKLLEELASKLNDRVAPGNATVMHTPGVPVGKPLVSDNAALRNDPPGRTNAATPTPIRQRPAPTSAEMLRHTVTSGETLSKIATHYYGSGSGKVVQALYAANRSVMKSPDRLRVGVALQIPRLAGFAAPTAGGTIARSPSRDAARTRADRAKPETARAVKSAAAIRWYQVKKSDRYASIARRLLGDSNRWREIFELNKEKFPDPNRIREGVRIKIPAARAATLGSTRP